MFAVINSVLANQAARGEAEAMPEEVPRAREPLEQTRKRLEACLRFPTTPPAGNA